MNLWYILEGFMASNVLYIHTYTLKSLNFSIWRRNVFFAELRTGWYSFTNGEIPQVSVRKQAWERQMHHNSHQTVSNQWTNTMACKGNTHTHKQRSSWVNVQICSLDTGRGSKPSKHSVLPKNVAAHLISKIHSAQNKNKYIWYRQCISKTHTNSHRFCKTAIDVRSGTKIMETQLRK